MNLIQLDSKINGNTITTTTATTIMTTYLVKISQIRSEEEKINADLITTS